MSDDFTDFCRQLFGAAEAAPSDHERPEPRNVSPLEGQSVHSHDNSNEAGHEYVRDLFFRADHPEH
jgi:hypothetical protein